MRSIFKYVKVDISFKSRMKYFEVAYVSYTALAARKRHLSTIFLRSCSH